MNCQHCGEPADFRIEMLQATEYLGREVAPVTVCIRCLVTTFAAAAQMTDEFMRTVEQN